MEVNWILKNICESIVNFMDGIFEKLSWGVNDIFLTTGLLSTTEESIISICTWTRIIAFSLITLFVMKQIFLTYVMETDGDPDADPLDLLMKASIAIALISCSGEVYEKTLKIATTFGDDLDSSLTDIEIENVIESIINGLANIATTGAVITCFFTFIYLIGTVFLFVKAGIRGVELCLMNILFPFFTCDIVTTRRERWNAFFTSYLVTIFGYTLQILCFRISGYMFCAFAGEGFMIADILPVFGFLYLSIKTPKWLEKFVYTSGLGQTVGGGARTGAYMIPSLLRMAK